MARKKTNKINLYRIKQDYDFNTIDISGYDEEYKDDNIKLFVQRDKKSYPPWQKFLKIYLDKTKGNIVNISSCFVFFIKHNNSIYALTGGFGHTKIKQIIEEEFGLEVALRMINVEKLSAINQKAMKGTTRQIYRAVSGYNPNFYRENYNRLLNSIKGRAEKDGKWFRVVGTNSLSLRTPKSIDKIHDVLDEIENLLKSEPKIKFPKPYRVVKNDDRLNKLNDKLLMTLSDYWQDKIDRYNLYAELSVPFLQFKCDRYVIRNKSKSEEIDDFDLDTIKQKLQDMGLVEINEFEDLKSIRFDGIDEAGFEQITNESFANSIICELTIGNEEFIKFGKKWYKILDENKKYIDEQIKQITVKRGGLPIWHVAAYSDEGAYNKHVADSNGFVFMHEDCVNIQGYSRIEVCDFYNPEDKEFYHIKKTWGSKSSYLFLQGLTSAEFYVNSEDFRKKCKEKWPDVFEQRINNGKIVFGIADDKALKDEFPLNLTFFAKRSFVDVVSQLKQLGFDTILTPIEIVG